MKNFKNWFIWKFLNSIIGVSFFLFFGFFFLIAFIGVRKKNNSDVQVMKENVIYIRPVGFEEKQSNDTIIIE